jgi:hypothetical protein
MWLFTVPTPSLRFNETMIGRMRLVATPRGGDAGDIDRTARSKASDEIVSLRSCFQE